MKRHERRINAGNGPGQIFLNHVKADRIFKEDGQDAIEYITEQTAMRPWKPASVSRQYSCLSSFLQDLRSKNLILAGLTKKDTVSIVTFLQNHPTWGESTRPDNWDRFQQFYKWAYKKHGKTWDADAYETIAGEEQFRYKVDQNKIVVKDIFTPAEVLELVNAEPNLAYKALWIVGFEGGIRIGEAMALRLRDVEKGADGTFTIHLPKSKTQKRSIPLELYSPSHLSKWIALHPEKGKENASLFINQNGEPIDYRGVGKRLKLLAQRAGFGHKIKVCFHSLRHSRATELATMMTEQQMCAYFGWSSSEMCQTYVRKGAIDLRQAVRRGYGIEKVEEVHEHGRKCLHCSHLNAYSAEYCDNCSLPLDATRLEQIKKNVDSIRMEALIEKLIMEKFGSTIERVRKEHHGNETGSVVQSKTEGLTWKE